MREVVPAVAVITVLVLAGAPSDLADPYAGWLDVPAAAVVLAAALLALGLAVAAEWLLWGRCSLSVDGTDLIVVNRGQRTVVPVDATTVTVDRLMNLTDLQAPGLVREYGFGLVSAKVLTRPAWIKRHALHVLAVDPDSPQMDELTSRLPSV